MRIGIQTWGSYGDLRPFLSLGGGLVGAGHEVTLYATAIDTHDITDSARRLGMAFSNIETISWGARPDLAALGEKIAASRNPITQLSIIMRDFFEPYADSMYEAALELCERNDIVLGHIAHYPLQTAALETATPFANVALFHGMLPTRYRPPLGAPDFGETANRIMWWLLCKASDMMIGSFVNTFRRRHSLAKVNSLIDDYWISNDLNLIGVSHAFCEPPADWDRRYAVCGYFDSAEIVHDGALSEELEQFLAAGEPPVFMSFGSMLPPNLEAQRETIAILSEATRISGCRAIIQAPLWRDCGVTSDTDIFFIGSCPHSLVFPRCRAVVHHGGSGTTQAATKAGVPSIIVIHLGDQMAWGIETRRIGVAPKALRRHGLTSRKLAKRLREVLDSEAMQQRAREAGALIQREDGVAAAVKVIEKTFDNTRPVGIETSSGRIAAAR